MFKGAEPIEIVTLLATFADLFLDNRKRSTAPTGGTVEATSRGGGFWAFAERLINELGLGVRDEGLFLLKLGKLDAEDRKVIDEVVSTHDKRVVNRLRLVTINVPPPPPTKVKGKKERKDKDGKVLEAGEPDKEIPSDTDNGVEFLRALVPALRGKSVAEQAVVLQSFNLAGKAPHFATEAMKVINKKATKALGLPENASVEQVVAHLEKHIKGISIPNPNKPREKDKAGWFTRFMRKVTPGSFPNS